MKGEPVEYRYETNLSWTEAKKGILKSKGKPDIIVSCPPEFGGHKNIWSPEDLLLASVEVCIMTTFIWFIQKENLSFESYASNAVGKARLKEGKFRFCDIDIDINITINSEKDIEKIKKIMIKVERSCLITNSITAEINLHPVINVI